LNQESGLCKKALLKYRIDTNIGKRRVFRDKAERRILRFNANKKNQENDLKILGLTRLSFGRNG
jgi:hypothetical protein